MSKSPERKEFEKMKRQDGFYSIFGGKDSSKDLHHKKGLSISKNNDISNLVYLLRGLHRLFHRLKNAGETDDISFRGKNPSNEKVVDDLGKGCLEKHLKNEFIEDVIKEMKSRRK